MANESEELALVPMDSNAIGGIAGASLLSKIAGVVTRKPAVVIGSTLVDLALVEISALPKAASLGSRVGYGASVLAWGALWTWWALSRRDAAKGR